MRICLLVIALLINTKIGFADSTLGKTILRYGTLPHVTCGFVLSGEVNFEKVADFILDLQSIRNPATCELDPAGKPAHTFFKTFTLIDSPGGDLHAALDIINLIKKYKLVTHVDAVMSQNIGCLSSCALVFAAGSQRHYTDPKNLGSATQNNTLGIHKPYFTSGTYDYLKSEKALDRVKYELVKTFADNGLDPRFTITMFETPSEDIKYPLITEMLIWRVISSLALPEFYKAAGIQNYDCIASGTYLEHVNALERFNGFVNRSNNGEGIYGSGGEVPLSRLLQGRYNVLKCLNYHFLE